MRSYRNHLSHTNAPEAGRIDRKPTLRSSAIFPVFQSEGLSTRICFLGYWMVKRGISEIHSVLTLRSDKGRIIRRSSAIIREPKAYRIELEDLLSSGDGNEGVTTPVEFAGSLEIEFFSSRDLVYAYPAVVVNYYGPSFGSVVHTAQRVYNDAEDRNANREAAVAEAGFNVYADGDREPFFSFVNGFEPVKGGSIRMRFHNDKNEVLDHDITVPFLAPYETTTIYPDRHLDLQGFLNGKPGTARIAFDVDWVFPRIIAGNIQHSKQAVSVTHTYYDCSSRTGQDDYWNDPEEGWHPASMLIPVSLEAERFTRVNFYPIYSPSRLEIDIELYDEHGRLLGRKPAAHQVSPTDNRLQTLDLGGICSELGVDSSRPLGANLIARPVQGSRLPTRLKVGLDYGLNEQSLPCNICKSMDVYNPMLENKMSSFHWAPVIADQADGIVWILNSGPRIPYERHASITLSFYREKDTATIVRNYVLPPNGFLQWRLSEDETLMDFFGGTIGWYVCMSDNPHVKTYYLCESVSGIVGGDHDF
ncbi:hypothetical protein [Cohnella soli]|uniref:DUF2961 domain-containing protein n=1 Tax=Cohnella soli TaxID=425005 RepID=A0ABW0HXJ6_9BACL